MGIHCNRNLIESAVYFHAPDLTYFRISVFCVSQETRSLFYVQLFQAALSLPVNTGQKNINCSTLRDSIGAWFSTRLGKA